MSHKSLPQTTRLLRRQLYLAAGEASETGVVAVLASHQLDLGSCLVRPLHT